MNQPILQDPLIDIVGVEATPSIPLNGMESGRGKPDFTFEEILAGQKLPAAVHKKPRDVNELTANVLLAMIQLPPSPLNDVSAPVTAKIATHPVREKPSFEINIGVAAADPKTLLRSSENEGRASEMPRVHLSPAADLAPSNVPNDLWQIERTPIATAVTMPPLRLDEKSKKLASIENLMDMVEKASPMQSLIAAVLPQGNEKRPQNPMAFDPEMGSRDPQKSGKSAETEKMSWTDLFSPKEPFVTPGESRTIAEADPAKSLHSRETVIRQILERADLNRLRDGQPVTLELHPKELGHVRMEVLVRDQQVTLDVQVDSSQVKQTLDNAFPEIREALRQHGFSIDHCHVQTADFSASGFFQGMNSQQQSHAQSPFRSHWNPKATGALSTVESISADASTQVNILA